MYNPAHFQEQRTEVLHEFIRANPLATLVTLSPSGLLANHIPMILGSDGLLRGHVARANPVWQEADKSTEALAIFHGPEAYVSPSWYPSKRETGKVVPTWNYVAVHVYGSFSTFEDPGRLRDVVETLTNEHEASLPMPWRVSDAPEQYINALLGAIVGVEMAVTRIEGKWKASQNRPEADRQGVVEGLSARGNHGMASVVRKLGPSDRS